MLPSQRVCSAICTISLMVVFSPDAVVAIVTNESSETIFVKEENSDKVHPVKPGKTYKGKHDGIAVPAHEPGKVFKSVDNVDIKVDKQGKVSTSGGGVTGSAGQEIFGGWKDDKFIAKHGGWSKLHEKSKTAATPKTPSPPGPKASPPR